MSSSPKPTKATGLDELQSHGEHHVAASSTVETSKEKAEVMSTQEHVDTNEKELHKVCLHLFGILIEGESRKYGTSNDDQSRGIRAHAETLSQDCKEG